jgi:SNF2 family DNA or RNA helicase
MKARLEREGRIGEKVLVDGSTQFLAITLPDRENLTYEPTLQLLKEHDFRHEPSNRRWWLRDRHRTLNFLAAHERTLREELDAGFSDNFRERTKQLRHVKIDLVTIPHGKGFKLSLRLSAGEVEPAAIYRAMAAGQHYVDGGKHIFLFDPQKLERLARAQQALSGEKQRALTPVFHATVKPSQLRDAEAILDDLDEEFVLPVDWTSRSGALKRIDQLQRPPLAPEFDDLLRNYQRIGVAWLWHLYRHELGGILADEMGLGKTIQALGLISCAIARRERPGPVLVVCPASLLGNWAREAARFTPHLRVFTHHRETRLTDAQDAAAHDLILTSYPTLARDEELFHAIEWNTVVADEAQHIKNRRTQAAQALRAVNAHARFVLTGTPIENSLDDLRSIFAFLLPGYLARMPQGIKGDDKSWFDSRHRAQAAPYILRRTKQLVAPELPPKIEQVVYCDFGNKQRSLYQKVRESSERAIFEMEMAGKGEGQLRLAALTQLLRLRQVCAEPRLLDDSLSPLDSAKLEAFLEILEEALDDGHRMLVFSQFVSVLQHLRTHLEEIGVRFCYLDGSTRDRLKVCDEFNEDEGIPVFLVSLKAGGVGLNLTGADTVVHFDPWWNPAVEDQATDRAHRIGQTRTVTSYKLIAANTVEEKVIELQRSKSELLRDLLDESAAANAKVSLADLKELMKA